MDCVTCMLVGMCMMCGPGFGAAEHGRPMTRAEVDNSLKNYLKQFARAEPIPKVTTPPSISYNRRQSFIADPRFTGMGIGKRQLDPYRFGGNGVGKRLFHKKNFLKRNSLPLDTNQREWTAPSYAEDLMPISTGGENDQARSLPWASAHFLPNFNSDLYQNLLNDMLRKFKAVEKGNEILESERRKLQERREKIGVDPFMTMLGIGK